MRKRAWSQAGSIASRLAALATMAALLLAVAPLAAMAQQQAGMPTLLVGPMSFSKATAREGEALAITVNVTSLAPAPGVRVILYENMNEVGRSTLNLTQFESESVSFEWNATRGYHQFTALAVTQAGETAPPLTMPYIVNSSIEVRGFEFSPRKPVAGDKVHIAVTLFNNKTEPLDNVTVSVGRVLSISFFGPGFGEDSVKELFNASGVSIGAMEERSYEFNWTAVYGNQTFAVSASQRTAWGSDALATSYGWIDVDNEKLDMTWAVAGIAATLLAALVLIAAPSFLNRLSKK